MCEEPYDGGPFLTYPVRENRPEIIPDAGQVGENPLREHERLHPTRNKEFEAFCQTWLFFGLINEVLGNICQLADFVRPDEVGDGRTISTSCFVRWSNKYESEAMAPEETCARLLASGWMRRLWTFLEGALSADNGRLWVQFHDQAVDLRSLWQEIVRITNGWGRKGLTTDMLVRMRLLSNIFRRETGAEPKG